MNAAPSVPELLRIPRVLIKWARGRNVDEFVTECSALLFRELRSRAYRGWRLGAMECQGAVLDHDSLLALNAYLRTCRAPRGGVFPFMRLDYPGATSRYGWAMFKQYLSLEFI